VPNSEGHEAYKLSGRSRRTEGGEAREGGASRARQRGGRIRCSCESRQLGGL